MKNKTIILFLTAALLSWAAAVMADQRDHLFEQANQHFQAGDYRQAIEKYQEILEQGYASADLYYNLGNSYFKAGENSWAILNYERALRLRPHDEDIRFNLQIANLYVTDKIPELPQLFYIRYFRQFQDQFDINTLTLLTLGFYFLFIGSTVKWLLTRSLRSRRIFRTAFIIGFIPLAAFSFTLVSKIHFYHNHIEAVVMSPKVDVRSAPTSEGTEIFTIHSGLKVKVIDTREEWREIRLPDGKEGWLASQDIEVI